MEQPTRPRGRLYVIGVSKQFKLTPVLSKTSLLAVRGNYLQLCVAAGRIFPHADRSLGSYYVLCRLLITHKFCPSEMLRTFGRKKTMFQRALRKNRSISSLISLCDFIVSSHDFQGFKMNHPTALMANI